MPVPNGPKRSVLRPTEPDTTTPSRPPPIHGRAKRHQADHQNSVSQPPIPRHALRHQTNSQHSFLPPPIRYQHARQYQTNHQRVFLPLPIRHQHERQRRTDHQNAFSQPPIPQHARRRQMNHQHAFLPLPIGHRHEKQHQMDHRNTFSQPPVRQHARHHQDALSPPPIQQHEKQYELGNQDALSPPPIQQHEKQYEMDSQDAFSPASIRQHEEQYEIDSQDTFSSPPIQLQERQYEIDPQYAFSSPSIRQHENKYEIDDQDAFSPSPIYHQERGHEIGNQDAFSPPSIRQHEREHEMDNQGAISPAPICQHKRKHSVDNQGTFLPSRICQHERQHETDNEDVFLPPPVGTPNWIWKSTVSGLGACLVSVPTYSCMPYVTSVPVNGHVPVLLLGLTQEHSVNYMCLTCDRLTEPNIPAARSHRCPGSWPSGVPCPRGYVCAPCGHWSVEPRDMFRHLESEQHARATADVPRQEFRSYLCPGCRIQFYATGRFLAQYTSAAASQDRRGIVCPMWWTTLRGGHDGRPDVIVTRQNEAPWTAVVRRALLSFEAFGQHRTRPVLHGCLACGRVGPLPWNELGETPHNVGCSACRDRDHRYFCVACSFVYTGGENLYLQHRHSYEHITMVRCISGGSGE